MTYFQPNHFLEDAYDLRQFIILINGVQCLRQQGNKNINEKPNWAVKINPKMTGD